MIRGEVFRRVRSIHSGGFDEVPSSRDVFPRRLGGKRAAVGAQLSERGIRGDPPCLDPIGGVYPFDPVIGNHGRFQTVAKIECSDDDK